MLNIPKYDKSILVVLMGTELPISVMGKYFLIRFIDTYGISKCMFKLDDLQALTGLSRQTILNCKRELLKEGYIENILIPAGDRRGKPIFGFEFTSVFTSLILHSALRFKDSTIGKTNTLKVDFFLGLLRVIPSKKRFFKEGGKKVGQLGKKNNLTIKNRMVLAFLWLHAGSDGQIFLSENEGGKIKDWVIILGINETEFYAQVEKLHRLRFIYLKFYRRDLAQLLDYQFNFIGMDVSKMLDLLEPKVIRHCPEMLNLIANVPQHICLHKIKETLNQPEGDYEKSLHRLLGSRNIQADESDLLNDASFLSDIKVLSDRTLASLDSLYLWVFIDIFNNKSSSFFALEDREECTVLIRRIFKETVFKSTIFGDGQLTDLFRQVRLWGLYIRGELQQSEVVLGIKAEDVIANFHLEVYFLPDEALKLTFYKK